MDFLDKIDAKQKVKLKGCFLKFDFCFSTSNADFPANFDYEIQYKFLVHS